MHTRILLASGKYGTASVTKKKSGYNSDTRVTEEPRLAPGALASYNVRLAGALATDLAAVVTQTSGHVAVALLRVKNIKLFLVIIHKWVLLSSVGGSMSTHPKPTHLKPQLV